MAALPYLFREACGRVGSISGSMAAGGEARQGHAGLAFVERGSVVCVCRERECCVCRDRECCVCRGREGGRDARKSLLVRSEIMGKIFTYFSALLFCL